MKSRIFRQIAAYNIASYHQMADMFHDDDQCRRHDNGDRRPVEFRERECRRFEQGGLPDRIHADDAHEVSDDITGNDTD